MSSIVQLDPSVFDQDNFDLLLKSREFRVGLSPWKTEETPATADQETPATASQETPATAAKETTATATKETTATATKETTATAGQETTATAGQETTATAAAKPGCIRIGRQERKPSFDVIFLNKYNLLFASNLPTKMQLR